MWQQRGAPTRTIGVLFVCLGNICRSPMAEAIFRTMVAEAGLSKQIAVDSAGTGAWHVGQPPHSGTLRALERRGISTRHVGRVVGAADLTRFDYLIALDRDNLRDLRVMGAAAAARVELLMKFAPEVGVADVPDPYHSGRFEETYALIEQGCRGLLQHLIVAERLRPSA